MKKIIVPVDFSEHSEFALKAAAKLAKTYKSELLVLHMLEMSDLMLTASEGLQDQKALFFFKLAEKRFEEFLDKDYLKGITVVPLIKHFKVFSEVNDVAVNHSADLIVMGSHGSTGLKEFFVGSNTEKVVRHSEIPVLVIKKELPEMTFNTAVYASDFSKGSIEAYLRASNFLNKLNTKMYLLHVNLPNDRFKSSVEIEKKVAEFLTNADGNLQKMDLINFICDYTVEEGILNFSNKVGADLIVIPTHGRKGLAHFFEGSITEDVANHATLPVITFKI